MTMSRRISSLLTDETLVPHFEKMPDNALLAINYLYYQQLNEEFKIVAMETLDYVKKMTSIEGSFFGNRC